LKTLFFKPKNAWAADFIPYYKDGTFHLFYLLDWRDPARHGEGTPWYKVSTNDFVNFKDHGEMIERGGANNQDQYIFTGSVIEANDKYHIFYTGHNRSFYTKKDPGQPAEAVMHAISDDLENWEKVPGDTFHVLSDDYEVHDWRDPFVLFNEEEEEYQMLLSARKKQYTKLRRGCTAICASKDLKKWELREPLWEPHQYYAHECPDLFNIGDWWYHVFSEFSDRHVTLYRMAKSVDGPWKAPENDMFDGRAYYAAKTASDGAKRYIFGWNPTKVGNTDRGLWQWGGNLVVHEIYQKPDGSLGTKIPDSVDKAFVKPKPIVFKDFNSSCHDKSHTSISSVIGAQMHLSDQKLPDCYKYEVTIKFKQNTHRCGIVLNGSIDAEGGYVYMLEPYKNKFMFEYWPNYPQYRYNGLTCERPIKLQAGVEYHIKVLVQSGICVAYLNNEVALSARMYDSINGNIGLIVCDGEAEFINSTISEFKK